MNARKMSVAAIRRGLGWEPKVSLREDVQALHAALAASGQAGAPRS